MGSMKGGLTDVGSSPESTEWFIEDHAFSRSYDLSPRHPLPTLLSGSSTGYKHIDWERKTRGGRGRGAQSFDRKKACSSINHSILSVQPLAPLVSQPSLNVRCTPSWLYLLLLIFPAVFQVKAPILVNGEGKGRGGGAILDEESMTVACFQSYSCAKSASVS